MTVLQRAEAAALGSALLRPREMPQVAGWLRASDFSKPWHAEVYTVIRERHAAGKPIDPDHVGLALSQRRGPRAADPVRILDLLRATPVRPQLRRYAQLVLEASLRREVAQHGVLLRAGALSASLLREAHPVIAAAAMVHATLDSAQARWRQATDTGRPPESTPTEPGPAPQTLDRRLGADRLLAAHPDVDAARARAHERDLVAALLCRPSDVGEVVGWLPPGRLLDPRWRAVYSAVVDLAERGEPIDEVTVSWRVAQTARRLGPGPDEAAFLGAVDAAVASDPRYLARVVAADLVRRTADAAAAALAAAAATPGLDLTDVLDTGRLHTAAVCSAAAGLPHRAGEPTRARHLTAARDATGPARTAPTAVVAE